MTDVLDYDVCAFSADGRRLAVAVSNRLMVKRRPFAGPPLSTAAAVHAIDRLQWNDARTSSADLLLCAQLDRGVVQVYDSRAGCWVRTVTRGYFGFVAARWMGPDRVLLTLEFHVALAVFDLSTADPSPLVYVETPKPSCQPCAVFDKTGTRLFVVSQTNGCEKILAMSSQTLDRVIYVQKAIGACDGLNKSPDDRFVCAFNSRKLAILDFCTGNFIGSVECKRINAVNWSSDTEYLALGCSSGSICVLNSLDQFNIAFTLCHSLENAVFDFFMESNKVLTKTIPSKCIVDRLPSKIASIAWSFDSHYLSTVEEDSSILYVWKKFSLMCVVQFSAKIKQMQWCRSKNTLSVVCGTELIFFWAENQMPEFRISPKCIDGRYLSISSVSWSFNNRDMILGDGKKCLLFAYY